MMENPVMERRVEAADDVILQAETTVNVMQEEKCDSRILTEKDVVVGIPSWNFGSFLAILRNMPYVERKESKVLK